MAPLSTQVRQSKPLEIIADLSLSLTPRTLQISKSYWLHRQMHLEPAHFPPRALLLLHSTGMLTSHLTPGLRTCPRSLLPRPGLLLRLFARLFIITEATLHQYVVANEQNK